MVIIIDFFQIEWLTAFLLTFRRYVELLCFDGFMNPTLRRPEPYIFAQAEGRRGFIKPDKLARLLPYRLLIFED
jgi:hypothetical protein